MFQLINSYFIFLTSSTTTNCLSCIFYILYQQDRRLNFIKLHISDFNQIGMGLLLIEGIFEKTTKQEGYFPDWNFGLCSVVVLEWLQFWTRKFFPAVRNGLSPRCWMHFGCFRLQRRSSEDAVSHKHYAVNWKVTSNSHWSCRRLGGDFQLLWSHTKNWILGCM